MFKWNIGKMLAGCLMMLGMMGVAHSQVVTADISGTTMDATGAVLPGAKVTVTNVDTNIQHAVVSDSGGSYSVQLLPPGNYRVTAESSGFKMWAVGSLKLALGDKLRIDPKLEIGSASETVQVSADSPAIQREDASVGTVVSEQAVQDLPLNGRNFVRLAQIAPGATEGAANSTQSGTRPDDRRQSSSVSVNAQTSDLNNFLIDGTDDNERFLGNVVVKPSVDAIQEMKVETNSYSAVVGRSAGGVISIVTKPGTNTIHGTAYEYFRNEVLDARPYFVRVSAVPQKPAYKQNQYGGSIGGPIIHDRTFYFGDYEHFSLRQGVNSSLSVPTTAMTAGLNTSTPSASACFPTTLGTAQTTIFDPATTTVAGSTYTRAQFPGNCIPLARIDPTIRKILSHYPQPNGVDSGGLPIFSSAPSKVQEADSSDIRIDHKISDRDSLFMRYSINDTRTTTPAAFPVVNGVSLVGNSGSFPGPSKQRAQGMQMNYTRTLTPNLVGEAKLAYTRFANNSSSTNSGTNVATTLGIPGQGSDPTSSGVPTISNGYNIGDATFVPIITKDNSYQELVNFTYSKGHQTFRFGSSFIQREVASSQSSQGRGAYTFDTNLTNSGTAGSGGFGAKYGGYSFASFLLDAPASTSRNVLLVNPQYGSHEAGFYFQDDWKVTQNLTINLGMRLEWATALSERKGRIANFDPGITPAPGTGAVAISSGANAPHIVLPGQYGVNAAAGVKSYYANFAPRVGFAYSLGSKTVIRGGYGTSYYPPSMGSPLALRNPSFVSLLSFSNSAQSIDPTSFNLTSGLPSPVATSAITPTGGLTTVAFNLKMPYIEQFNLTMQRELPSQFTLTVAGVGALTRRSILAPDINPAPPSTNASGINNRRIYDVAYPTTLGFSNGNPLGGLSGISQSMNWGKGEYYGLQIVLQRRFSHGVTITGQNSFAHSIDLGTPRYLFNDPKMERGNSDLDVRDRFTISANYALPLFAHSRGLVAAAGKGWQLNGITLWSEGFPFSVSEQVSQTNTGSGDRPNRLPGVNLYTGGGTLSKWFNTSAFALQSTANPSLPQPGQFGNSGRNTLRSPSYFTQDVSLFKNFDILGDRLHGQFRAEAFNVFNDPNFTGPGASLGSSSFGVINSQGNFLPRNMQFAMKFNF